MTRKLTLTIEQSVIDRAKIYARKKDRSLSNLIENYLKAITDEENNDSVELPPNVKALRGSFKMPKDFDYKTELSNSLSEKYL